MSLMTRFTTAVAMLTSMAAAGAGRVAAAHEDDESDGGVDIDINLDEVVDELGEIADILSDLTGDLAEAFTRVLFQTFWQPWLDLLHAAVDFTVFLLSWMPPTTLPEILDIHRDVFLVSTGLASVGFVVTGLAYIGYGPAGLSYRRLRPVIPKLLLALVFGGLAPWLLAPVVRLSEATAVAFAPQNPDLTGMLMMSGELVVVAFLQSLVFLAVIVVLAVTKIFVAFGVAAAPLLAVLWAVPFRYTRSAADRVIGAWWAALLVGPLDIIIFRLSLGLLSFDGFDAAAWVLGLASPVLMLGLPYLLFTAGVTAAAPALTIARGATQELSRRVDPWTRASTDTRQTRLDEFGAIQDDHSGAVPTQGQQANRFDKDRILDQGGSDA